MDLRGRIQREFPSARPATRMARRTEQLLRQEGFWPNRTLLGISTCPDELNRSFPGLNPEWGPAFNLGGLAGLPFTGPKGFEAYWSHLPDEGAALLVGTSHVGITEGGGWGRIHRAGQSEETACCGSVVAAIEHLTSGRRSAELKPGQQRTVTELLEGRWDRIGGAEAPAAEAATFLAESIGEQIDELIPEDPSHPLAVLWGVQINTPPAQPDFFVPGELSVELSETERRSLKEVLLA